MKTIYLLGATGSIGQQTLDIVRQHPQELSVGSLTAHHRINELIALINEFHPKVVSVGSPSDRNRIQRLFPEVMVYEGTDGLIQAAIAQKEDSDGLLVNALVGIAGLVPTVKAIEIKRPIALANKETLVVAGNLINQLLIEYDVPLYPIDSEHSAIWQCLRGEESKSISKIIITASGGSFRDYLRSHLESVTVEDALKHPNWSMGNKITIDSATMMNKGFEVIEAYHLFHVKPEAIETVIHRESIIHSLVEFNDHSIMAQLSDHDMHLPISYALFYPNRTVNQVKSLELSKIKQLTFSEVSFTRYPCLGYAYEALKRGGNVPAVLNAANEAAVDLFLNHQISFLEIESIIGKAMVECDYIDDPTLDELLATDASVKASVYEHYQTRR